MPFRRNTSWAICRWLSKASFWGILRATDHPSRFFMVCVCGGSRAYPLNSLNLQKFIIICKIIRRRRAARTPQKNRNNNQSARRWAASRNSWTRASAFLIKSTMNTIPSTRTCTGKCRYSAKKCAAFSRKTRETLSKVFRRSTRAREMVIFRTKARRRSRSTSRGAWWRSHRRYSRAATAWNPSVPKITVSASPRVFAAKRREAVQRALQVHGLRKSQRKLV